MIEQDIEKKMIDKINSLGLDGLQVDGLWQPTATGIVKGTEMSNTPAGLIIKVNPKGFSTFGISDVSMSIEMVLTVRIDMCPTGKELIKYCAPISKLLQSWNMIQCGEELDEDFQVEGFNPGGIHVTEGTGPELDRLLKVWTVNFSMTLEGAVTNFITKED